MIFLIIACTAIFNGFIERTHLPQLLIGFVADSQLSTTTVLLAILVFYLLLGRVWCVQALTMLG